MNQNEPTFLRRLRFWRSDAMIFVQVGPNLDAPRGAKWQRPKPLGSNSVGVPLKPTRPERSKSRKWIELGSKIWNILELLSWEGYSWGSYIDIYYPAHVINDISILIDVSLSVHFMSWKTRDILFRHDIKIATFAPGTQRKPITTDFRRYPIDDVIFFNILSAFRVYQQLHLVSKHTQICNSKETH